MKAMDPQASESRGVPTDIERQIRERGAVLDMPFTQSIYKPLLAHQRRDGVEVQYDLRYGEDPRHVLDVYGSAKSDSATGAVMVFLHGGGFVRGDKSDRENVGLRFAREGFLVLVANYRLAPAHRWPAGAQDVIAVYQWARKHASQLGGDPQRIFLVGESAGAAHVATATLVRRFHPKEGLVIAGAILISGVYNVHLERLARNQFGVVSPDPRNEPYYGSNFDHYKSMSTIDLIDAPATPLLITYAELDLLQMQVQAGELFARLVTQHGFEPQLQVIRGHNHLTQTYAVNTGDETLSAPLLSFMGAPYS